MLPVGWAGGHSWEQIGQTPGWGRKQHLSPSERGTFLWVEAKEAQRAYAQVWGPALPWVLALPSTPSIEVSPLICSPHGPEPEMNLLVL